MFILTQNTHNTQKKKKRNKKQFSIAFVIKFSIHRVHSIIIIIPFFFFKSNKPLSTIHHHTVIVEKLLNYTHFLMLKNKIKCNFILIDCTIVNILLRCSSLEPHSFIMHVCICFLPFIFFFCSYIVGSLGLFMYSEYMCVCLNENKGKSEIYSFPIMILFCLFDENWYTKNGFYLFECTEEILFINSEHMDFIFIFIMLFSYIFRQN